MTNQEIKNVFKDLCSPMCVIGVDFANATSKISTFKKYDFSKCRIIFNKENTVLIDNKGNKYVSITGHGDTFDKEKGVMMCMLKALGFNFTDISKLLNTVKEK